MTWSGLSNFAEVLRNRPGIDRLQGFLDRLMAERADDVAFVALFGSMARGDWGRGSDYDVLVGFRDDGCRRLIDRLGDLAAYARGGVEPIGYYPREIENMFRSFNTLLYDALADGVCLWDTGPWQRYRERLHPLIADGCVQRIPRGWRWTEEAEARVEAGALTI